MLDEPVNGTRGASPVPNGRRARQDKNRLSLAFLTKGVLTSEGDKAAKEQERKPSIDAVHEVGSETSSVHSRSRESKEQTRSRLSLNFLSPSSPLEALPNFALPTNGNDTSNGSASHSSSHVNRPETGRSDGSDVQRKGSMKKRLSFMHISKKSSKNSVKSRVDNTLTE